MKLCAKWSTWDTKKLDTKKLDTKKLRSRGVD
jgi:hypothetical protein